MQVNDHDGILQVGKRSKARQLASAVLLAIAGFILAGAGSYLLGLPVGKLYVLLHNACSTGKISEVDFHFHGVHLLAFACFLGGIVVSVSVRKSVPRALAIGALVFGGLFCLAIRFFVWCLTIPGW